MKWGLLPLFDNRKNCGAGVGGVLGAGEAIPEHTAVHGQSPLLTLSSARSESGVTAFQYLIPVKGLIGRELANVV